MAKGSKGQLRIASRRTPYLLHSRCQGIPRDLHPEKCSKALDNKDWEGTTCSVCMECPHNAVLLLCSSHDKGCRPYMCGTSFRYSNCLEQYKKFHTKVVSSNHEEPFLSSVDDSVPTAGSNWPVEKCEVTELSCPLCRGQVKGWTVVEPARQYLNSKRRSCMQDDCNFVGSFKELRKHMKVDHPCAQPREVDPTLEQKWRSLGWEQELEDVISTIRSTIPGAMVFGDYVIERNQHGFETDGEDGPYTDVIERDGLDDNVLNFFLMLHAFGSSGNGLGRQTRQPTHLVDENAVGVRVTSPVGGLGYSNQDDDGSNMSLVSQLHRHGRVLLGRSGRRRRRRENLWRQNVG